MMDLSFLPNSMALSKLAPRVTNDEYNPFFELESLQAPKTTYLPPGMPAAPFKLDFTMVFAHNSSAFPLNKFYFILQSIISYAVPESVRRTSSSPEFREFVTLRKLLQRLESELIIAQIYVDAEAKAYYSNLKVIFSLSIGTIPNFNKSANLEQGSNQLTRHSGHRVRLILIPASSKPIRREL